MKVLMQPAKRYGQSITGLAYIHHHHGPVPANHELVYGVLQLVDVIDAEPYDGPYEGEVVVAKTKPDETLFTEDEVGSI